jgi:hypothetical protein
MANRIKTLINYSNVAGAHKKLTIKSPSNLILSIGVLAPIYAPLHLFFNFSLNVFFILSVLTVTFSSLATTRVFSADRKTILKVTIYIICCTYLYSASQKHDSGVLLYAPFTLLIPFLINGKTFDLFEKLVLYLTIASLLCFLLYLVGVGWFRPIKFDIGGRPYFLFGLTVSEFEVINFAKLGTLRFYGFSNEPGQFGTLMLIIMLVRRFRLDFSGLVFMIAGILTFSSSFYVLLAMALLIMNIKNIRLKISRVKLRRVCYFIGIVFFILAILIASFEQSIRVLDKLLFTKVLYLFNYWGEFTLRFSRSIGYIQENGLTFFGDSSYVDITDHGMFGLFIFSGVIGLILYILAISSFPTLYWPLFLAMGFYRVHFIYNAIPMLTLFICYEYLYRKNTSIKN